MIDGARVPTIQRGHRAYETQALALTSAVRLSVAEIMPPPVFLRDGGLR